MPNNESESTKNKVFVQSEGGLDVFSLNEITDRKDNIVVVASSYACEITEQLQNFGFTNIAVYPSLQIYDEYKNKKLCKEIDTAANSFNKEIIAALEIWHLKAEFLNREEVYGHKKLDEIKQSVNLYLDTGTLPKLDSHFTNNTCDPYTSNWAEHLIEFDSSFRRDGILYSIGF